MTKPQLDAGASRLLAGRYQLLEELATGGMASVWKGHDQVLGRDVAIKLLREDLAADGEFAARFRQEAVHAANLNHPGIVGVFDIGAHDGVPYIVMELVDGRTIRQLLAREGLLQPAQAARIALGVAQALAYAHRLGVIHRNLKPANVLLTQAGSVKVSDFAIAKAVDGEDPDRTGEILGPGAGYLAPEQLSGGEIDGRADLYALGVCLFEMLTGTVPWKAEQAGGDHGTPSPGVLRPGIPPRLDEIVGKAMASAPDDRFADAQELATALRDQVGRPAPQPAPPPPPPPPPRLRTTAPLPPPDDHTPAAPLPSPRPRTSGAREPRLRHAAPMAARRPESTTGQWLGPIVAVVIVFAAIATLVATGSLRSNPDAAASDPTRATSSSSGASGEPLAATAISTINPKERGGEKNELAGNATDGSDDTGWTTQSYTQPIFGGLKAGVGLILEADGDSPVRLLELRLAQAGGSAKVYAASQPVGQVRELSPLNPASALEAALEGLGWQEVAGGQDLQTSTTFELADARGSRFFLIWVTSLPEADPNQPRPYRLEIREARLFP